MIKPEDICVSQPTAKALQDAGSIVDSYFFMGKDMGLGL